jgi:hypothetical protein
MSEIDKEEFPCARVGILKPIDRTKSCFIAGSLSWLHQAAKARCLTLTVLPSPQPPLPFIAWLQADAVGTQHYSGSKDTDEFLEMQYVAFLVWC